MVTLAVYTYFAAALMGAQWVQPLSAEDYVTITKLPAFSDVGEDSNNATAAADGDGRSYQGSKRPELKLVFRSTGLGKRVVLRMCKLASRGQRKSGGGIHAT